jgi:hypothetical protein
MSTCPDLRRVRESSYEAAPDDLRAGPIGRKLRKGSRRLGTRSALGHGLYSTFAIRPRPSFILSGPRARERVGMKAKPVANMLSQDWPIISFFIANCFLSLLGLAALGNPIAHHSLSFGILVTLFILFILAHCCASGYFAYLMFFQRKYRSTAPVKSRAGKLSDYIVSRFVWPGFFLFEILFILSVMIIFVVPVYGKFTSS